MIHFSGRTMTAAFVAGFLGVTSAPVNATGDNARDPGTILIRAGTHVVIPESPGAKVGGANLDVQTAAGFTFNVTYFVTPNWAVELLAAAAFSHDIELGGAKVTSTGGHGPATEEFARLFGPGWGGYWQF
jgi:outer membrane protein